MAEIDKIKEIQVEGTQRIDIETIVYYANVEIDDIYTEELGNNILRAYLIQTYFLILKYHLILNSNNFNKENPTINLVKFTETTKLKMKVID